MPLRPSKLTTQSPFKYMHNNNNISKMLIFFHMAPFVVLILVTLKNSKNDIELTSILLFICCEAQGKGKGKGHLLIIMASQGTKSVKIVETLGSTQVIRENSQ